VGEVIPRKRTEQMAEMIQAADERLETQASLFGTDTSQQRASLANALNAIEEADEWSRVREITLTSQMREKQTAGFYAAFGASGAGIGGLIGTVIAPGVGTLLGGALGTVAGLAVAAATHPLAATMLLQRLGGSAQRSQRRLAEGSGRVRRALSSGKYLDPTRRAATKSLVHLMSQDTREEEYRRISSRVIELSGNPLALESQLAEGPGAVSHAISPALGDPMAMTYVRGVQYLAQHVPAADQTSVLSMFGDDEPSLVEMDSFLRRWEALEDPSSILHWLAEGALEVEHVETLSAVYPELLTAVRSEIAGILGDLRQLPSYQQRADLGTLLGVPADESLSAQTLHALQQTYSQTPAQQRAQTSPQTTRSISMSYADDTYSSSQSVEQTLR
jgi:hypothetical protein